MLSELLEPEGVCLTLAENGRLAVEAVGREGQAAFDLVLMDIQMPEMDGYAATRALRKLAPELPIIGLTAHALAEEREKTCAAGMVDHVTKPVQLDELVRAIHRALSAAVRTAASPECRSATAMLSNEGSVADNTLGPPDESEKIASIGLNWPALIYRYNGKIQFIERLLQRAVADYREMPDRLRAIAERGDWPQGAFLAHNIKSIAGNLDADALAILATDTENALREGRADGGPRLGELADAFATMLDVIDRHLAASDSGDAAAINQKKFSGQYGKIVLSPEACQASRQST
ncbi:response regulator [bacterium]|nr:response regulator [bacterium]